MYVVVAAFASSRELSTRTDGCKHWFMSREIGTCTVGRMVAVVVGVARRGKSTDGCNGCNQSLKHYDSVYSQAYSGRDKFLNVLIFYSCSPFTLDLANSVTTLLTQVRTNFASLSFKMRDFLSIA